MTDEPRISAHHLEHAQIDGLIRAAGVDGTREILKAFWSSTRDLTAQIRQMRNAHDYVSAAAAAHAIKGSAANVGAAALADIANEIEAAFQSGDAKRIAACVELIESNVAEAQAEFEDYLDSAA
ncbi:MAG: Hpt domain-containing protein [Pseudomonadota bacterium]